MMRPSDVQISNQSTSLATCDDSIYRSLSPSIHRQMNECVPYLCRQVGSQLKDGVRLRDDFGADPCYAAPDLAPAPKEDPESLWNVKANAFDGTPVAYEMDSFVQPYCAPRWNRDLYNKEIRDRNLWNTNGRISMTPLARETHCMIVDRARLSAQNPPSKDGLRQTADNLLNIDTEIKLLGIDKKNRFKDTYYFVDVNDDTLSRVCLDHAMPFISQSEPQVNRQFEKSKIDESTKAIQTYLQPAPDQSCTPLVIWDNPYVGPTPEQLYNNNSRIRAR